MDKAKAVELIKELSSVCSIDLERTSLIFMPKNSEGIESRDAQLHILTSKLNLENRTCIMALMDKWKWKYAEESDKIVVF